MGKFKDINSAIEKLKSINDRKKQLESISLKSVDFSKEEQKLLKQGVELKKYVALIARWLDVKIFPKNSSLYISKGYLVYDGKKPNNMEYSHEDFLEIIEEGQELLEGLTDEFMKKPTLPEGKKVIYNFMYVYNTIVEISTNFDKLVKEHIKSLEHKENGNISHERDRINKEKAKLFEELQEIKDYFDEIQNQTGKNSKTVKMNFGNGYYDKVFLGYGISKSLDEETAKIANDLLGIELANYVSKTPVYYELNKDLSPIVINCKSYDIKAGTYLSFIEDLALYFIASLPAKKIRFAGIECEANTDGILEPIFDGLRSIFYNERTKSTIHEVVYTFDDDKTVAEDSYKTKSLLKDLNSLIKSRKRKYTTFSKNYYGTNAHSNFFDYNNRITDNQDELIVVLVNNYPKGFEDEESQSLFRGILEAKTYGFVTILLQDTTPSLYEKGDTFSTKTYIKLPFEGETCNTITDIDNMNSLITYNGKHLSFEGNIYGLTHAELAKEIADKTKALSSFNTMDLIKKTDPNNYSSEDVAMRFPIGLNGSMIFDFATSVSGSPHTIILGGTGSGKTALLHTIILNAAATYSPDEIQFYLSDFKSAKASGAFAGFLKGKEMYIPHVKHLSLKATGENAKDMLSMIRTIHNERMEQISRAGYEDIVSYNNSKLVKDGSEEFPKMSRICFIIDEYAVMIAGAGKNGNVLNQLSELLRLVRTSGIFIILCGQSDSALGEDEIKQIDNRILLKSFQVSNPREFIRGGSDVAQDISSFATCAGRGSISLDGGMSYTNVNLAFSGGVGSDLIKSICKYINNKYKDYKCNQIIAGDESIVDIQTDSVVSSLITKNFENGYNLYIGQSSISYAPVAVRYYTSQKDANYILAGEKEMIDRVKQNTILSFLHTIALTKQKYTGVRVYDCWLKIGQEKDGDALVEFKKKYPVLNKYIKHVEDKYEIAETIMDIYSKQERDEITEPILLVVHGASAIASTGEYVYEESEEKANHNYEAMVEAKKEEFRQKAALSGQSWPDAMIEKFARQAVDSVIATTETRHDNISCQMVRDCLKVLHRSGHLHNVFVLLAEGTYEYIEQYVKGNDKAVYSSISDRVDIKEFANVVQYPTSCCHIKSNKYSINEEESQSGKIVRNLVREEVDTKVKLYDYSLKTNKLWWEEFIKLLNN